ncbi:MAG: ATP synthase A1 subunit C [Halobacteriales archaeon]
MTRLRHTERDSGSSNPAYVNARVRSRRAALLDEADYRKLVRMGPNEIARFLEETEYEREVNELGARHSGVDLVEYALNANLSRHFDDLLRWADGRLYEQIARYLRKFDAWNLKTVLRGQYTGADREAIETDLIRAGEFTDRELDRMLEAEDPRAVIEVARGSVFYEPARDALDAFEETGLLIPLENAIDRAFYQNLVGDGDLGEALAGARLEGARLGSSSPDDLYREFLIAEIDFLNVRNALRIARSGAEIDPNDYVIEGGRLFDPSQLARLARDLDDLVAAIRDSAYGDELAEALDVLEEAESLLEVERAIDRALIVYGDRLGSRYPVSVCPVIAYVLAKEQEVQNVRAIARGREAGLTEEEIREELVLL